MKITTISVLPQIFNALSFGVIDRAIQNGTVTLEHLDLRDFTLDKHRSVDDRPYGGGPGMVMMVEPLRNAIRKAKEQSPEGTKTIFLSPQGKRFDQSMASQSTSTPGFIFIAGRYEGIDERVIMNDIDEEWSIGDYVLSGGELAAMVIIDSIIRLLPGVLGHEESANQDSFTHGLLDCPHYTRPESIHGEDVPKVLLSGDHQAIARWRLKQALGKTWIKRKDLINAYEMSENERLLLNEFIEEYGE